MAIGSLQSERFQTRCEKRDTIPSCKDGKMTIFSEILKLSSDGMKNIVDIWTRSCPLISHTQQQELSVKDMRTILLLASMVKDTSLDQ